VEDVPLLMEHFIKKYSDENAREVCSVDPAAMKYLMDYDWPGNVRELENAIERVVVLSPTSTVTADLLPRNITAALPNTSMSSPGDGVPLKERVGNFEKALILAALEKTQWNQKKAAQILAVNTTTLSEKLKRLKIKTR
jgi:DNA-binding NtrC family response regulator